MKITVFGSCRQESLYDLYPITSIRNCLTYPHYSKEIVQAIEFCKGVSSIPHAMTQCAFRSGILGRHPIDNKRFIEEFQSTDLFVVEIASRISYVYNGWYVHHILEEPEYGFGDITNIVKCDLTDQEIEEDILRMKDLFHPKPFIIVSHIYTRKYGKRYDLVNLLKQLTSKHCIPFINPSEELSEYDPSVLYQSETVLSHYTPKGVELIRNVYTKYIERMSTAKKTVVLLSKMTYINMPSDGFWGLGDIIRGICGVYETCKKMNYDIIVDISRHPFGKFMKDIHVLKTTDDEISNIKFECFSSRHQLENFLVHSFSTSDVVKFFTNCSTWVYDAPISTECKDFIRNLLTPNEELQAYIESILPTKPYGVMHFRLGDTELVGSNAPVGVNLNAYFEFKKHSTDDDFCVLISDSQRFKHHVKSIHPSTIMYDVPACHIGTSTNDELIKHTLAEFFLITRSKYVKTFSVYGWTSGFVHSACLLYGVQLIRKA